MSAQAFLALMCAAFGAVLCATSWMELKNGRVRSLFWHGNTIDREREPNYFWFSWVLWAGLALWVVGMAAWQGWNAVVRPDPTPMTRRQVWELAFVATAFALLFAWIKGHTLWRRGPPWRAWKDLQRERQLRKLIHALADDPSTGVEGESIDEFARYADLDWLEEIVAHLSTQPAPRSLLAAIEATDPPVDASEAERPRD